MITFFNVRGLQNNLNCRKSNTRPVFKRQSAGSTPGTPCYVWDLIESKEKVNDGNKSRQNPAISENSNESGGFLSIWKEASKVNVKAENFQNYWVVLHAAARPALSSEVRFSQKVLTSFNTVFSPWCSFPSLLKFSLEVEWWKKFSQERGRCILSNRNSSTAMLCCTGRQEAQP